MTQEVLEAGPRAHPRRTHAGVYWAVGLVVLVVVSVLGVAVTLDYYSRASEAHRLVTSVEASEAAMTQAQDKMVSALEGLSAGSSEQDRQKVRSELQQIAAEGEDAIASAGQGIQDVNVLPWHTRVEDAKRAYLAHNAAWVAYMAAAAKDADTIMQPQDDINRTFAAARIPLLSAILRWDPFGDRERVVRIFEEGSKESDSGNGPGQSA